MTEKGVIKYKCDWIKSNPVNIALINDLNAWRKKLYALKLIGVYSNGIGYGNISRRTNFNEFLISGTATGHLEDLNEQHYTQVMSYNFKENSLICKGPIQASSESLTHAAIYESSSEIQAVIHVHSKELWIKYLNKLPSTNEKIEYGTPEMALDIKRLFLETNLPELKVLVMGGHEDGLITFGNTLEEAGQMLLKLI